MTQQTPAPENFVSQNRLLLEEHQQAKLFVGCIHELNELPQVEVGQLNGMLRVLKNAERVLAKSRAALVSYMIGRQSCH